MRINPTQSGGASFDPGKKVQGTTASDVDGSSSVDSSASASSAFKPTGDLLSLRAELARTPEVREDAISAAAEKVRQGYYNTAEAIESTAKAIVEQGD